MDHASKDTGEGQGERAAAAHGGPSLAEQMDAEQAASYAAAALCINHAHSMGVMYQSGVLQHQQMMMTSHAAAMKGIIELYRTCRAQAPLPCEDALLGAFLGIGGR